MYFIIHYIFSLPVILFVVTPIILTKLTFHKNDRLLIKIYSFCFSLLVSFAITPRSIGGGGGSMFSVMDISRILIITLIIWYLSYKIQMDILLSWSRFESFIKNIFTKKKQEE